MARHATFYKLLSHDAYDGMVCTWHRRRRDAVAYRNALPKEEQGQIQKMRVELSTDGLIRWLNIHFNTDNG